MKHSKRLLSTLLLFALVLSLIPTFAAPRVSAATGYDRGYAGGMAGTGSIVAHGVDVSEHQGVGFNFQNLKDNGYSYVILRCGFVSRKDYRFEEYYAAARAAGLDIGVYFYSYASTAAEASAEADLCLSYIAGKTFEYPVYFDFEDPSAGSVGGTNAYNICTAFLDKIAAAGYLAGLYGYAGWFDPNYGGWVPVSSICSRYECWIANYYDNTYTSNPRGGNYSTTYGMWQYTSTNYIGGVGPLDTNVCYKDYPSIVKTYGFNGYSAGKDPIGWLDSVTAVGPGKIKVSGWTLDEDEPTKSLTVHIYIGGGPGDPNGEGHVITANVARDDVASLYPSAGKAHGFEAVISTGKSGNQEIIAYGINVGSGGNALLNNSGCTVNIPADTEKPTISDIKVTNLTGQGYTVTATVSDNVGIKNVSMPTWTMPDQDDIIWEDGTISGNTVTLNVNFADHNFEYGTYATHLYAYDLAGNCEAKPVYIEVPSILANEPISGTVEESGTYFIANAGNRNFVLDVNGKSLDNNANVHLWRTLGYGGNQMWQFKKVGNEGYYSIINVNSGKALDVTDALTANGSNVAQFDPNSTAAQLWKPVDNGDGTYTFISKCSGRAMDLKDAKLANGQNIQIYDSNGTNAQKWYLIPADLAGPEITDIEFSEVTSEGFRVTCTVDDISGIQKVDFAVWTKKDGSDDLVWHPATVTGNKATYYVSISDHNTEPGDYDVHIYAYDGVGNSHSVNTNGGVTVPNKIGNEPVSGKLESGTYFIASSLNLNYVLDVAGVSMDNNANVHLWLTSGTNLNHMWQIRDADGDGYYNAVAVHSGKALDVTDANTANGSNVAQYGDNGTPAQLWKILPNDDGTYSFFNMCSDKALDLKDGKVANGQNIQIYESNGSAAQKWYLIPAKLSEDVNHIHTYLEETVTEPTCEEVGYTTHICENCGYSYTENEVPALGHDYQYSDNGDDHTVTCGNCDYNVTESHSYENGVCLCGAEEIKPTEVTVKIGHAVSFDSDLQMNYRIKYDNLAAAVPNYVTEGAYLVVEKDRYPTEGEPFAEAITLYPDLSSDPNRMLFNLPGIQSVEMGSELRAVLYFFDADGNKYATALDSYSILDYVQLCYDTYTYEQQPKLYTLLIDCLNYGAAAQLNFNRRTDTLVNAGMEAYQQYATKELSASLTDSRTYIENDRSITAVTDIGFSVTFTDKTELNARLRLAADYSKEDISSVKVLNEDFEEVATLTQFTELTDGRLQVTFTGIKSVNMRDMFYFVAYVGDQPASQEVGYSVEAYAKSSINSSDSKAADLARACMYYGDSAKACFT